MDDSLDNGVNRILEDALVKGAVESVRTAVTVAGETYAAARKARLGRALAGVMALDIWRYLINPPQGGES